MPISESDYSYDESTNDRFDLDLYQHVSTSATTSHSVNNQTNNSRMMSKAELRKTHKPIMEKRRRAKINNCLNEIKDLILSAMKKDPERHSKLEKADILEMAVKHLKTVQKQEKEVAIRADPTLALKYKSGYLECASEVSSFVDSIEGVDAGLKQRLTSHLNKCANGMERPQFDFTSSTLLASFAAQSRFNNGQPDDQNNNGRSVASVPGMQGIELIPSCLPNGDFAFLVPKSSFSSILNSGGHLGINVGVNNDRLESQDVNLLDRPVERAERPSAFVTVMPRPQAAQTGLLTIAKPLSPPISPEMPKIPIHKPKAEKLAPLSLALLNGPSDKIQSIKFPINTISSNPQQSHFHSNAPSMKKEHEPLSIITNVGERYRQAQRLEESRNQEENRHYTVNQSQGFSSFNKTNHINQLGMSSLKRKAESDGLLTVAPLKYPRIEIAEDEPRVNVSAFKCVHREPVYEVISDDESEDSSDGDGIGDDGGDEHDTNEPMWRPW